MFKRYLLIVLPLFVLGACGDDPKKESVASGQATVPSDSSTVGCDKSYSPIPLNKLENQAKGKVQTLKGLESGKLTMQEAQFFIAQNGDRDDRIQLHYRKRIHHGEEAVCFSGNQRGQVVGFTYKDAFETLELSDGAFAGVPRDYMLTINTVDHPQYDYAEKNGTASTNFTLAEDARWFRMSDTRYILWSKVTKEGISYTTQIEYQYAKAPVVNDEVVDNNDPEGEDAKVEKGDDKGEEGSEKDKGTSTTDEEVKAPEINWAPEMQYTSSFSQLAGMRLDVGLGSPHQISSHVAYDAAVAANDAENPHLIGTTAVTFNLALTSDIELLDAFLRDAEPMLGEDSSWDDGRKERSSVRVTQAEELRASLVEMQEAIVDDVATGEKFIAEEKAKADAAAKEAAEAEAAKAEAEKTPA